MLQRRLLAGRPTRHAVFEALAIGGTPDIRVIAHQGEPCTGMLRLPTRESRGWANLHQGAVGVGVDIPTGRAVAAVCNDRAGTAHPDTGAPIVDIGMPCWSDVLIVATKLSRALELGYGGVDIVLDAATGPVVMEGNARPGLAIQIANGCGLLQRPGTDRIPIEQAEPIRAGSLLRRADKREDLA